MIIPQVAGQYIWYAKQMLAEISHIQFYSGSNQWIADVDNLQNYMDIVVKKETSLDEFSTFDKTIDQVGLSNEEKKNVVSSRNSNMSNANVPNGAASNASLNYVEPSYFGVGAQGAGGVVGQIEYTVQVPLKRIKNTIFSVDKSFYFGQTTYLKLYFGSINKVCYSSSANDEPNNGVKNLYAGAALTVNVGCRK